MQGLAHVCPKLVRERAEHAGQISCRVHVLRDLALVLLALARMWSHPVHVSPALGHGRAAPVQPIHTASSWFPDHDLVISNHVAVLATT